MTSFLRALVRVAILVLSCVVVFGVGYVFVLEPRHQKQDPSQAWMLRDLESWIKEGNMAQKALPLFREEVRRLEQEVEKQLPTASARGGISELLPELSRISKSSGVTLQRSGAEGSSGALGITVSGPTRGVLAFFEALGDGEYPFLADELRWFVAEGVEEALRAELVIFSLRVEPGEVAASLVEDLARAPDEEAAAEGIEEESIEGIVFVRIHGGSFKMGHRWKTHQVTLRDFWIGKYEVTNEQYGVADGADSANLPVTRISWTQARDFCESRGFRLPTEAEWEYAARAGSETLWSFGDDESLLGEHAWFWANSKGSAHEVGTKKPSPWGIHDMHGNVWEWVADWYGPYTAEAKTNPQGPSRGTRRVLRGGSFKSNPYKKLSAVHRTDRPLVTMLFEDVGFRCARDSN